MHSKPRIVAIGLLAALAAISVVAPITAAQAESDLNFDRSTCLQGQIACWCVNDHCYDELTGYDCYASVGIYYDHPIGFICTPSLAELLEALAATSTTTSGSALPAAVSISPETCLQGALVCWCINNGCYDYATGFDCYASVGLTAGMPIGFICTPRGVDLPVILVPDSQASASDANLDLGGSSTETCLQGRLVCWCINNGCYDYATGFDCYASVGATANHPVGFICTPDSVDLGELLELNAASGSLVGIGSIGISPETCLQGQLVCWCINNGCYDYATGFDCYMSVGVVAGFPIGFICTPPPPPPPPPAVTELLESVRSTTGADQPVDADLESIVRGLPL